MIHTYPSESHTGFFPLSGDGWCACSVVSESLRPRGLQATRLLCPWNFQEKYWSGLPFPALGDLPDPGTKPASLASPASAGDSLPPEAVKVC